MAFLIFSVKTVGSTIKVSFKNKPVKLLQNVEDNFFKAVLSIKSTIFSVITEWVRLEGE